jgi:hypothetical protein
MSSTLAEIMLALKGGTVTRPKGWSLHTVVELGLVGVFILVVYFAPAAAFGGA